LIIPYTNNEFRLDDIGVIKIEQKVDFEEIKERFQRADVDEKIKIYTTTQGLSVEQFKELLRMFPLQHLDKLERAMA